jgi:CubicO group peptidase (beta-lactamase class C family)
MRRQDLERQIDEIVSETEFSGVLRIRRRGETVVSRAAGYADRANGIANTIDTRFAIASGSKFFTALAVGRLIDAGKLDLETRVAECIPRHFPLYSREITVRQLLTHTSGIPDYYDEEKVTDFESFRVAVPWCDLSGPKDYLAVFPDEPMKFAPGERFSYSNSGYILLGVVIEELSGLAYRDFVAKEVFETAGMTDSGYFALNRLPARTALGYVEEADGRWRTNVFDLPIVGASDGGAFTTAADVGVLWEAFFGDRILSSDLRATFTAPCVETGSGEGRRHCGHGLWILTSPDGRREESISGCDSGVSFESRVDRRRELEVTVMSNTSGGAWPVIRRVEKIVAGRGPRSG